MTKDRGDRPPFQGFRSPTYTPVPDELFDELLPELSGAELKVLLYIIRRTFGFKRERDSISLSQMLHGIQGRDGEALDRGAGISKPTLLQALRSLETRGIIATERRRSAEKGDEPTVYTLRFAADEGGQKSIRPVGKKVDQGGGQESSPRAWSTNLTTQETDEQQTDFDLSNFERFHDRSEATTRASRMASTPSATPMQQASRATDDRAGAVLPLGEILARRAAVAAPAQGAPTDATGSRRRSRVGSSEERELVAAYLRDWVAELGDEAPLSSTVTRALAILKQSGLPQARWPDLLYAARATVREHSAQIRKQPANPSRGFAAKNRTPYYLAVLEDLAGIRIESSAPASASARRHVDEAT